MLCPICEQEMGGIIEHSKISALTLRKCSACGFYSVDLNGWKYPYKNKDYYQDTCSIVINSDRPFYNYRVRHIGKFASGKLAVDLGCGLGETAVALAKAGFEAHGVEESANAITLLRQRFPFVTWHNSRIETFLQNAEHFDVITMFHVLEHIPRPASVCRAVSNSLAKDGVLVIEVPDVSGGQARLKGWDWHYWLPHHVNYFSLATLRRLLEPLGFQLVHFETKYHFGFPQGVRWRDMVHSILNLIGLSDIITTYWRKVD